MGQIDQARLEFARLSIGAACGPFAGIFCSPTVLRQMPHYTARIIKFPERRNEIAKLRSEIQEMSRTVSAG